ncbi:MAG: aminoacyl-tRNA hydrolase [Planctomycetes bacterium]|nr:aminoacyl-tRNA hydrolase [Planctomycetota bacterium]
MLHFVESERFQIDELLPWVSEQFDRGGGPGGQNVNKVSTRVTVLFDFEGCAALRSHEKQLIRQRLASRLAADGRLRIVTQTERSQAANRRHALDRLVALLTTATHVPEKRHATRPTAGSRRRRLNDKRRRSSLKQQRRGGAPE